MTDLFTTNPHTQGLKLIMEVLLYRDMNEGAICIGGSAKVHLFIEDKK
jgi:hypothetical protein